MEIAIDAGSPLVRYSPCRSCDLRTGFQSPDQHGVITTALGESRIALNFSGTGISFAVTASPVFTSRLLINGTQASRSSNTSVDALPLGTHAAELVLTNTASQWSTTNAASFTGATITSGWAPGGKTTNATIDDTAWQAGTVLLTPGWNMLEQAASNWINQTQHDLELPTLFNDYNASLSWTEQAGASTSILFHGSAVQAYGLSGAEAGRYQAWLDGEPAGEHDGSGLGRVYNMTLFAASGLADGPHNLTLVNVDQGKRLSFDRAVVLSGLTPAPLPAVSSAVTVSATPSPSTTLAPPSTTPALSSTAPTAAAASSGSHHTSPLPFGAILGIAIGASILLLAILATTIAICCRRRRQRPPTVFRDKPTISFPMSLGTARRASHAAAWTRSLGHSSQRSWQPLVSPTFPTSEKHAPSEKPAPANAVRSAYGRSRSSLSVQALTAAVQGMTASPLDTIRMSQAPAAPNFSRPFRAERSESLASNGTTLGGILDSYAHDSIADRRANRI